jgi:hypothetical protein
VEVVRRGLFALLLLLAVGRWPSADAQTTAKSQRPAANDSPKLTIALEPLGDSPQGVVTRATYRYVVGTDVPGGVPLVLTGSISQDGAVIKRFRYPVDLSHDVITAIQTLQPGAVEI